MTPSTTLRTGHSTTSTMLPSTPRLLSGQAALRTGDINPLRVILSDGSISLTILSSTLRLRPEGSGVEGLKGAEE